MQTEWFIWVVSRVVKYQSLIGAMFGSLLKVEQDALFLHKGVLTTIYVNIQYHLITLKQLKAKVERNHNKYKKTQTDVPDIYTLPSTKLLKELLFRLIEYDKYNRAILSKLTFYFTMADSLSEALNNQYFYKDEKHKHIEFDDDLFRSFLILLSKLQSAIDDLISLLEKDQDIEKVKAFYLREDAV